MLVLGLQGSPRKKGNTRFLLRALLDEIEALGGRTRVVETDSRHIEPCREYTLCEKKGVCPIKDDMHRDIYALLREADVVVAATPVFFYNMTAQLKALVDRCQVFWSRKYLLKLRDPRAGTRRGFLLSVGASRGKKLFDAIELSLKIFFDALDAAYVGSLTYRGIEGKGEMARHATVADDVRRAAASLMTPFAGRKRVLFAGRRNACRSQMAAAYAQQLAGDRIDALSAGRSAADALDPEMVAAMAEAGIDMGFGRTRALHEAIALHRPELIVAMGCGEVRLATPGIEILEWDLPEPDGQSAQSMRATRREIKKRVVKLANAL
jgi:multimeric flavodoxin WrbA/protein-tyrosine-phosphatase